MPDTLASIANYFKGYGWQPRQPYGEGTANFEVIRKWNKALVYAKTVAAFAEKLEAQLGPRRAAAPLSFSANVCNCHCERLHRLSSERRFSFAGCDPNTGFQKPALQPAIAQ